MFVVTNEPLFGEHRYEVVDAIPPGYVVWNISNPPEGYLPLAKPKFEQPFPGGRDIEPDTLKAIATDGAKEIIRAVTRGYKTAAKMRRCIERNSHKPSRDADICRAALPFMEAIENR